jgi:DNA-binding IclR family transcriptional regulator
MGGWAAASPADDPEVARLLAVLTTAGSAGLTVTEMVMATGRQKTWVYERLAELQPAGVIQKVGQGRYRLAPPPQASGEAGP